MNSENNCSSTGIGNEASFSSGWQLQPGLSHYYFGDGKGKTTALIGLLVRALGQGLKPILIQFLKRHVENGKEEGYFMGKVHFLKKFIKIKQFGEGKFVKTNGKRDPSILKTAQRGLDYASKIITGGEYDLVALDEIVNAISMKILELDSLLALIRNKPEHVELICTGMMFYRELKEAADYVVGFSSVNHPYRSGIAARKGIEY